MRYTVSILLAALLLISFGCSDDLSVTNNSTVVLYPDNISVSPGTISFDRSKSSYSVLTESASQSVTVTAKSGSVIYFSTGTVSTNYTVTGTKVTNSLTLTDEFTTLVIGVVNPTVSSNAYTVSFRYVPKESSTYLGSLSVGQSTLYQYESKNDYLTYVTGFDSLWRDYKAKFSAPTNEVYLAVSTNYGGQKVYVNGTLVADPSAPYLLQNLSDTSVNNITVTVASKDGSRTNAYTLGLEYLFKPVVSTDIADNVTFDGGIDAYLTLLSNQSTGGMSGNGATVTTVTSLTGVVTAVGVYMHSSGNASFYIQDKDRGICVFTSTPPSDIKPGYKVSIEVTSGKLYYGMPEAIAFANYQKISEANTIYLRTGNYNTFTARGTAYYYNGTVESEMDNFSVGAFDSGANLHYHSDKYDSDVAGLLKEGQTVKCWGPVNYSYNLSRLELPSIAHFIE